MREIVERRRGHEKNSRRNAYSSPSQRSTPSRSIMNFPRLFPYLGSMSTRNEHDPNSTSRHHCVDECTSPHVLVLLLVFVIVPQCCRPQPPHFPPARGRGTR